MEQVYDSGPIYAETDTSRFIVEPFNALSAVFFILIVIYWLWRLRGEYRRYAFMTYILVVLGIGGVGGVLYHAFRSSEWYLLMDYLPITICCLSVAVYFLWKLYRRWEVPVVISVVYIILWQVMERSLPMAWFNNLNYSILGFIILLPTLLWLRRTKYDKAVYVWLALVSFALALSFRILDIIAPDLFPMGTHWLWHTFGAMASNFLILYFYKTRVWVEKYNNYIANETQKAA
ncbi:MAG: hypothetical protein JJT94_03030 [Bernardetiaceae bacterium]|nr:hypothetical protein [Bernardetiaceae bacterium]